MIERRIPLDTTVVLLVGFLVAVPVAAQRTELNLPTPAAHFVSFDVDQQARTLGAQILSTLDPLTIATLAARLGPDPVARLNEMPSQELLQLFRSLDLSPWRQDILELLLHQSRILDVFPGDMQRWVPLFHDALMIILDGMDEDRLALRIAEQAVLPADTPRGERMLSFMARTPIFQKIGQILARNPTTDPDIRESFQRLENQIETVQAADLVVEIQAALGHDTVRRYQIEFESEILGEASVGAVIGATLIPTGASDRRRVVAKVIKDYAVVGIRQDVASIEQVLFFLEEYRATYDIGSTPLVEMFSQVLEGLEQEVQVADEQANLRRARQYFATEPRVIVPALYDLSTDEVTVMERIEGFRVTEAHDGDPEARRQLARRLLDITVFDVLFSETDTLFHGDPHAGNVFWSGTEVEPDRVGLIDWGLMGYLELGRRRKLAQVVVGLFLGHRERLHDNIDGMLTDVAPTEEARAGLRQVADEALARAASRDEERRAEAKARRQHVADEDGEDGEESPVEIPVILAVLNDLLGDLPRAGYAVHGDVLLYIKSLFTVLGVASDLDRAHSRCPGHALTPTGVMAIRCKQFHLPDL